MRLFENAQEVVAHMEEVDQTLRDHRELDPDHVLSMNIHRAYTRHDWGGNTATPIPPAGLRMLRLRDVTADRRWGKHFAGHRTHVALYQRTSGFYWLLRFDPYDRDHYLDHIGSVADVEAKILKKKRK
jgi:hypothetical protein